MAATVTMRVVYGAPPGTTSGSITGVDFESADNAENSLANRLANPIIVGNRSYEKWLKAYVEVAPDNKVENFECWGDGEVEANTTLYLGKISSGSYSQPVTTPSTVATVDWTVCTSGSKYNWSSGSIHDVGAVSDFVVFQLDVEADADPGNWANGGEQINYEYDES